MKAALNHVASMLVEDGQRSCVACVDQECDAAEHDERVERLPQIATVFTQT